MSMTWSIITACCNVASIYFLFLACKFARKSGFYEGKAAAYEEMRSNLLLMENVNAWREQI